MDVHVKAKKPLARRCRCGMTFDAGGCLMQVTPEEYAALKADPWLDVAIMDPEDTELSGAAAVPRHAGTGGHSRAGKRRGLPLRGNAARRPARSPHDRGRPCLTPSRQALLSMPVARCARTGTLLRSAFGRTMPARRT